MKIVFISGPITVPVDYFRNAYCVREERTNIAREAAVWLVENGIGYYSPHLNSHQFDCVVRCTTKEFWYEMDLRIASVCDGILMLPGWEESKGASGERIYFVNEGKPVFSWPNNKSLGELLMWSKE